MNTLKQIAFCLAASAVLATGALAQSQASPTTTTLSVALTGTVSSSTPGSFTDVITLASCSGLTQNSVGQYLTELYVDFEALDVAQVVNLTACQLRVVRGAYGTAATLHNSGATVYVGSPQSFGGSAGGSLSGDKLGACIAANEAVLPWINVNDGRIFSCPSGGQWVQTGFGTMGTPPGQTLSAFCTGTVGSAATEYLNSAACCNHMPICRASRSRRSLGVPIRRWRKRPARPMPARSPSIRPSSVSQGRARTTRHWMPPPASSERAVR